MSHISIFRSSQLIFMTKVIMARKLVDKELSCEFIRLDPDNKEIDIFRIINFIIVVETT